VVYTIISGNTDNSFFLNPNSGVLSTNDRLDYEKQSVFNLTVLATNMVGATASLNMLVHVRDVNDNPPIFAAQTFNGSVSEGSEVGTMVMNAQGRPLVVGATDADSGDNARLDYRIVEPEARKYFAIDSTTGALRTAAALDHETTPTVRFSVQVTDQGRPPLSARNLAVVTVNITDVNDTPPRFTKHAYLARILLPTYKGVSVVTVEAVDPDTVNPMALTYSIVDGNHGGVFGINPQNGQVYVDNTADMQDR
jgi:protocadherin Fat 1/2/3